jgi:bifunctional non-homologous end joining protein LigD
MTAHLPQLATWLARDVQLDGELVAYGHDGRPDFHRLSARMLHGDASIPVTYWVFDLLAVDGLDMTSQPYSRRRSVLEALEIEAPGVRVVETFDDGCALFDAVCAQGMEGVVAKRERDEYRPGERVWVKTKNRGTARFAEESRIGERRAKRRSPVLR